MGTVRVGAMARRVHGAERMTLAILCILGVLAWLLTMSSMSHGQPESANTPAHAHASSSVSELTASAVVHPAAVSGRAGGASWNSTSDAGIELACAILGTGCLIALIALIVYAFLSPPTLNRADPPSAMVTRVPAQPWASLRPSLIALSISRT